MQPQPNGKKVIIVEDHADLAEIYKTRLELKGYSVKVANDGIAALYLIQSDRPDLVLLDLMVPSIAGDEVLKRMRASEWGKNIPVFIISNLSEADAPSGLRSLGISGYEVKASMHDDDIDNIVERILNPSVSTVDIPAEKPISIDHE